MTLQRIIEELENIIEQVSADEEMEKDTIMDAIMVVVRDAKGTNANFTVYGEDDFCYNEDVEFSSLADLEN
mgnify:CR=1 FL=1